MKLSYVDILGDGLRHEIEAEITTDHPASHYGQSVIVLDDGGSLDLTSWVLLNYQVIESTPEEFEMLKKVLSMFDMILHEAAVERGRKGGQAKSEAKTRAAHENAKKNRPRNK